MTPNNDQSSRSHAFADICVRYQDQAVAKFTILDMGGSEDVGVIQAMYFDTKDVVSYNVEKHLDMAKLPQSQYGAADVFLQDRVIYRYVDNCIKIKEDVNTKVPLLNRVAWTNLCGFYKEHGNENAATEIAELLKISDYVTQTKLTKAIERGIADIETTLKELGFPIKDLEPASIDDKKTRVWMLDYINFIMTKKDSSNTIQERQTIGDILQNALNKYQHGFAVHIALQKHAKGIQGMKRQITNIDKMFEARVSEFGLEDLLSDAEKQEIVNNLQAKLNRVEDILRRHHCPIRNQGNYINSTIADLTHFTNSMAGKVKRGNTYKYKTMIADVLSQKGDTAYEERKCDRKFVLFANIRLDFDASNGLGMDTVKGEDVLKAHYRKALQSSLDFADTVNPFNTKSK